MDAATVDAVRILNLAADACENDNQWHGLTYVTHAIRHLVRPERDVFPKSRKGTKRQPVRRFPTYKMWGAL